MENRIDGILTLAGFRAGGAGLLFVMAPRWCRKLMEDFLALSDNQLRIIGYVLLGTGMSVLAQQATRRALAQKIDAIAKAIAIERTPLPAL